MWIYTPPGFSPLQQTYPLLVPFDGFSYVNPGMMNAPSTLDNLVNERRIRPLVVCFLGSVVRAVDLGFEGAAAFGDAIVRELLPRPRSSHGVSTAPGDVAIGGSSAGGLAAALSALDHSDAFGNVLSQSGAFRFPAVGKSEPNAISQRYAEAPRLPIRFHIETGIYENLPSAGLPLHELAVDEGVTTANRHFRDVLRAKGYDVIYRESATAHEPLHWRATLADALIALFNPAR
jgi:enterochelin esterase family protein